MFAGINGASLASTSLLRGGLAQKFVMCMMPLAMVQDNRNSAASEEDKNTVEDEDEK
jgi:hypothetical protein